MDAAHVFARGAGMSLGSSVAATRRATWRLALPALLLSGAAFACALSDALTGPKTAAVVLRFSGDTQLVVGDTAAFAIAAEIDGAPVSTPRFRFTIEDTLVASRTAAGDSIVGRRRGRTNLVASLTSPMLPTPPTLRVALNVVVGAVGVVPASDTLTSIDDTLSLAAPTFDAHDVPITGASATWVSSDTTVAVFVAPGRLVARRNGQVTVQALVDNDTGMGSIVIAQRLARVQASTPVVVLSALTAESTLVASGVDARGHLLSGVPISWSSEASTIASVTQAGRVRAVDNGTTRIVAQSGVLRDTVTTIVEQRAKQITIPAGQSSGSVTLQVTTTKTKGKEKATMTLQPANSYTVATKKKANVASVVIQNK